MPASKSIGGSRTPPEGARAVERARSAATAAPIEAGQVEWSRLSARGRVILRHVAVLIAHDELSYAEVSARTGIRPDRVARLMRELREELRGDVRACVGCAEPIAVSRGLSCGEEACRRAACSAAVRRRA